MRHRPLSFFQRLKQRTPEARRNLALMVSGGFTGVILLAWLAAGGVHISGIAEGTALASARNSQIDTTTDLVTPFQALREGIETTFGVLSEGIEQARTELGEYDEAAQQSTTTDPYGNPVVETVLQPDRSKSPNKDTFKSVDSEDESEGVAPEEVSEESPDLTSDNPWQVVE